MKTFIIKIIILTIFFSIKENIFSDNSEIFFSQIQWMWTTKSSYDEWIELKNNTNYEINLEWWKIEAEDWSPNFSFDWIINWNWFFLLERSDDNSAYQIKWDYFYTWTLENWWEILFLKNSNWEIIDKIDTEKWQSWNNSTKESMLKTEDWEWINWKIDWNPRSSKINSISNPVPGLENETDEENIEIQNIEKSSPGTISQEWQNWQNQISKITNVSFEFQRPSYTTNSEESLEEYFCDKSKDECKINFNFEKTFEWFSESDYFCEIDFWFWETWEENKCNPNTVIFPIWNHEISIKIFNKEWNFLEIEKKIFITNLENIEENMEILKENSINIEKKEDLSIKNWISKNKFRIKKISLNETNWDFVEIFCLDCEKNSNIWWYKIYNTKNIFFFPIQKYWEYNLKNKNEIKIFLKKEKEDCEKINEIFENKKLENFKKNQNDKTDNLNIFGKTDIFKNEFCTNLKSWFTATNWSLFLMNQNWEILDSICWQNWKEIKWKTSDEINILKNNNLWKWECLDSENIKKWDIFERIDFSGYNSSESWKKFNINEIKEEKNLEETKNSTWSNFSDSEINLTNSWNLIQENLSEIENWEKSYFEKNYEIYWEDFFYNFLEEKNFSWSDLIFSNLSKNQKDIFLEKIKTSKKIITDEKILENNENFLKNYFQEKTKFYDFDLPKERSRVFKIKWRTDSFAKIEINSEFDKKIEIISDEKWYFKIYFDKLSKWEKNILVNFYFKWEKILEKNLNFILETDWISSKEKNKIEELKKENKQIKKLSNENKKEENVNEEIANNKSNIEKEEIKNPIFEKMLNQKNTNQKNITLENTNKTNVLKEIKKNYLDKIKKIFNFNLHFFKE